MGDERTLPDELRAQRAVIEHQGGIIETQAALPEELAARLARIEAAEPGGGDGGGPPVAPPSGSTNRSEGALVKDSVQDLWYCVATGTPDT